MSYQIDVNINASDLDNVAAQIDNAANSVVKAAMGLAEIALEDPNISTDAVQDINGQVRDTLDSKIKDSANDFVNKINIVAKNLENIAKGLENVRGESVPRQEIQEIQKFVQASKPELLQESLISVKPKNYKLVEATEPSDLNIIRATVLGNLKKSGVENLQIELLKKESIKTVEQGVRIIKDLNAILNSINLPKDIKFKVEESNKKIKDAIKVGGLGNYRRDSLTKEENKAVDKYFGDKFKQENSSIEQKKIPDKQNPNFIDTDNPDKTLISDSRKAAQQNAIKVTTEIVNKILDSEKISTDASQNIYGFLNTLLKNSKVKNNNDFINSLSVFVNNLVSIIDDINKIENIIPKNSLINQLKETINSSKPGKLEELSSSSLNVDSEGKNSLSDQKDTIDSSKRLLDALGVLKDDKLSKVLNQKIENQIEAINTIKKINQLINNSQIVEDSTKVKEVTETLINSSQPKKEKEDRANISNINDKQKIKFIRKGIGNLSKLNNSLSVDYSPLFTSNTTGELSTIQNTTDKKYDSKIIELENNANNKNANLEELKSLYKKINNLLINKIKFLNYELTDLAKASIETIQNFGTNIPVSSLQQKTATNDLIVTLNRSINRNNIGEKLFTEISSFSNQNPKKENKPKEETNPFLDRELESLFMEADHYGNKYQTKEEILTFQKEMSDINDQIDDVIESLFNDSTQIVERIGKEIKKEIKPKKVPDSYKNLFKKVVNKGNQKPVEVVETVEESKTLLANLITNSNQTEVSSTQDLKEKTKASRIVKISEPEEKLKNIFNEPIFDSYQRKNKLQNLNNSTNQEEIKNDFIFNKGSIKPNIDYTSIINDFIKKVLTENLKLTDKIFNSQIQPLQQWKLEFPKWWNDSPIWVTDLPDWWNLNPQWSSELPVWWNQEILPKSDRQKLLNGISGNQKALNSTGELVVQKPYNSSSNKNQDNRFEEILDAEIIEEVKLLKEGNRYLSASNQKLLSTAKDSIENPFEGQRSLPADLNYIESPWIEQEKVEVESTLKRLKPQVENLSDFLTNIDQKLELIKRETILKLPQGFDDEKIQNPWGNDKYSEIANPWKSKLEGQSTKPQLLLSPDPNYQENPWIEQELKKTNYKLLQLKPAISSLSNFLVNIDQQIESALRIGIPQIAPLSGSSVRAKFAENNTVENPWKLPDALNQLVPRNPPQNPRENNPNVGQQKPQSLLNPAFGSITDPWVSFITLAKNKLVEQQKLLSGSQPLLQLKPAFEPTIIGETFNTLGSSFDGFISHIDSQLKEKGNVDFPETIGDFETFLKQINQNLENISSSEFCNFLNNIDLDLDRMQKSGADEFLAQIDQELSKFPQRKNIKGESTDIQGSTKEFLLNSAEKIWPLVADKPIPKIEYPGFKGAEFPAGSYPGFPVGQRKLDQPVFSSPDFVKLFSSQIPQKPDLTEFFKPYNKNSSSEEITIDVAVISKVIKTIAEAEAGLEALSAAAEILGKNKERTNKTTGKGKDEKSSDAQLIRELIQEINLLIAKKDFVGAKELAGEGNLKELSGSKSEYQQIRIDKAEQKDIFEQAKQRADVFKNLVTSKITTAKEIGQINAKDLFGNNLSKVSEENNKKAELLIDKVNQWLLKEAEKFQNEIDSKNLSTAKKKAELGTDTPLRNVPINGGNFLDVAVANNRESENQLKSQRRKLTAELAVAMSILGSEQKELIAGVLKKIQEQKTKINSPEQLGSQKTKDLETLEIQKLENKANNRIDGFKDSGGSTNALRDLQAAQASISQFVRELKELVAGFIGVSSAVNKEVIKLSVANNGNLTQTEQDIKLATDSAKRFGGSVSGYLKDLAGIKIADQRTIDRSGSLSNNRYTDGDVKSLLSGLRSAYSVNQLNGEQQDGASNAVLQILSKGKVQAEELRGQLGDRLNGAVNLFAQALGISTAQLDRRLKEGSILDLEIFKFGRLLEQNYSKAAEKPTLIKETTAIQGNVKDFATLATQPLAGIATVSAQFVNQMADGFKSNASLFTVASVPIGLLLAQGISGGVANAFTKSSFVAPIISALGSSFKANLGTLGIVGGGLGVAVAASSILGTSGLDQTISRLGDKIKDLVDWAAGLTKNGLAETNKVGKNVAVDAAFGILPLAAVISPITSYIANGLAPTFDRFKEGFSANNKFGSAAPQKTSLLTNISNGIGNIDRATLGNTALAITTAVAAYAIANTTFISKYQKISEQLATDLGSKTKTDKTTFQQNLSNLKEKEGTDKFNLDTFTSILSDFKVDVQFNNGGRQTEQQYQESLKQYTTARLEGITKSNLYTDSQKQAASDKIQERSDKGFTPGQNGIGTYAGRAAKNFLEKTDEQVNKLYGDLQSLTNTNNYKKDFEKAKPTVDSFRNESSKLYRLQSEGGSQQKIDTQEIIVKKLQTEARKATESITDAQLGISAKIKELEAQKTNLENSGFAGSKEKARDIENYLEVLRKKLPEVNKTLESFSNPDQFISDRRQEIARKKNSLELSEVATKGQISQEKSKFVNLREGDGNDFSDPVRQAGLGVRENNANELIAKKKYDLAKESRELLSKATYSEDNRQAYVESLKAEAEALAGVKEATYNTINARQSEKKAIEEFLQVTYDQKVRNFGSFKDSENYGVGKSAKSGNVEDAILYGKLQKAQYELEKFKEILPKLTLNADAAKEKLKQLSDNVVLARLAYLDQSRSLISERIFAEKESVIDFSPFFENQRDIQAKSEINIERKQDEFKSSQALQSDTREALLKTQDPTERANLAIKLIQLETDEIKKKYDLELAYLDLAKKKLDTAISQLNSGIGFSAGNATRESENQQYVRGRELEKRLSQAAAPNGGTLTPLGENQERIGLAKNNLNTLRSENEKAYQSISDSFLQIEGTTRESANAFTNLFKGKTSNQLKTDLALFDQQITTAKADPNRESNQVDNVFGKGLDLNYAPVLREAASQIQQLKEKEQGLSAALEDLENQRSKMTNDVIRNTVDLKNSNATANQELAKRNSDLTSTKVDFEKGTGQTIQDKLDNKAGKGRSFSGFLDVENTKFVNSMVSAKKQLEIVSKEVEANLKVLQNRETAGASPEELKNLQEKIKTQNIRVANAKLQVAETEQKGIEGFLTNLLAFDSGLENLFEGASTKLKEAVDLLNQTITQVGELGLGTQFNLNKIVQTKQVGYQDKSGQFKTRDALEEFEYDPNKTGSQEEAKIRATISKRNAEIEAKKQALAFLKTNSEVLSNGSGVENTEQFKSANENTKKLMLQAQSLLGQLGISTTDYKQNIEDITKILDEAIIDPSRLQIMLDRNQQIQNRKENIQTLELQSTLQQNREKRLNNTRGITDVQRILLGNEPLIEDNKVQRQKAKLEYDISQEDGNSNIQKARGKLIYRDKIEDLDQQFKNLPKYGERFLFRIEEAVASSANIGGVLEKAIEEGNWSNVLKDILSNIVKSLAGSYGQDAGKGAGDLLSQGLGLIGGLFGGGGGGVSLSDGATGIGVLASHSQGFNLPNYANGYNMGSDYPKTTQPDYREPGGNSHLAVIGRDEMVIPPDKIQSVLSHEKGVMASSSVSNVNTVNNSPTNNNTTNNYSFASAGRKDSFGRPVINDQIDEQRRRKRHE